MEWVDVSIQESWSPVEFLTWHATQQSTTLQKHPCVCALRNNHIVEAEGGLALLVGSGQVDF